MKAERDKALDLAKDKASFIVDVLKINSPTATIPNLKNYFDLGFRIIHPQKSQYINLEDDDTDSFHLNLTNHSDSNHFPKEITNSGFHRKTMEFLVSYYNSNSGNELSKLIFEKIHDYKFRTKIYFLNFCHVEK